MKRILIVLITLLAACAPPDSTPTPPLSGPTPTPTTALNPVATPEPAHLSLWLPDWMLLEEGAAENLLQSTIDQFSAENGIGIDIVIKMERGEGGLLDFLTAAHAVAPGLLPDLIALPFSDAEIAAANGLLHPLGPLLSTDLQNNLYPFARDIARTEQGWLAVPFIVDFEHLAFQPAALSDPPVNWSILLETDATYAFPAAGPDAVLPDAILLHYLSVLANPARPRDPAALAELLAFYENARLSGRIDPGSLQATRPSDTWTRVLGGNVTLGHTTAGQWLANNEQAAAILRFGPVPSADSTQRTIAHGWAYAIITADPDRQIMAANLIETLMAPNTLAAWSHTADLLPARRAALEQWPAGAFTTFAAEALEGATRPPAWTADPVFVRSLHRAALDVLSGTVDAATATQTAIASW